MNFGPDGAFGVRRRAAATPSPESLFGSPFSRRQRAVRDFQSSKASTRCEWHWMFTAAGMDAM